MNQTADTLSAGLIVQYVILAIIIGCAIGWSIFKCKKRKRKGGGGCSCGCGEGCSLNEVCSKMNNENKERRQ